jgi:hypothetical protein
MAYIADPGLDPAFPPQGSPNKQGITVRDYFAAAALQGICATLPPSPKWEQIADQAYAVADAIVKLRQER